MTNYHPDPQRAYESHCADGYVVPDDETGPQEAAGATESDVPRVQAHGDGAGLREAVEALADEWANRANPEGAESVQDWTYRMHVLSLGSILRAVLAAHPATTTDARGALDETLDDLTRTLARAEKAEAEVARYQRLVSWHEWHGSDAEARARRSEAALREVSAKVRREMKNYYTSTQNEGFEVALNIIDAALSDTTGEATR